MIDDFKKRSQVKKPLVFLAGIMVLVFGLVFSIAAQPAHASAPAQAATATATVTTAATLAPPVVTGTPTVLVPVTGADQTQTGGQSTALIWLAIGLLGLLLLVFGIRSYRSGSNKQQ